MIQPEEVGAKIRAIRKAQNMSQEALAEECYMSAQTISKIESGKSWLYLPNYLLICEGLKCTPNDIFM